MKLFLLMLSLFFLLILYQLHLHLIHLIELRLLFYFFKVIFLHFHSGFHSALLFILEGFYMLFEFCNFTFHLSFEGFDTEHARENFLHIFFLFIYGLFHVKKLQFISRGYVA